MEIKERTEERIFSAMIGNFAYTMKPNGTSLVIISDSTSILNTDLAELNYCSICSGKHSIAWFDSEMQ